MQYTTKTFDATDTEIGSWTYDSHGDAVCRAHAAIISGEALRSFVYVNGNPIAGYKFEGDRIVRCFEPAEMHAFELNDHLYRADAETLKVLRSVAKFARETGDGSAVQAMLSAGLQTGRINRRLTPPAILRDGSLKPGQSCTWLC